MGGWQGNGRTLGQGEGPSHLALPLLKVLGLSGSSLKLLKSKAKTSPTLESINFGLNVHLTFTSLTGAWGEGGREDTGMAVGCVGMPEGEPGRPLGLG